MDHIKARAVRIYLKARYVDLLVMGPGGLTT